MISAGSAVSDSSTAPRTDCSASRFCGGVVGPSNGPEWPLVLIRSGALTGRPSLGPGPARIRDSPAPCDEVLSESAHARDGACGVPDRLLRGPAGDAAV